MKSVFQSVEMELMVLMYEKTLLLKMFTLSVNLFKFSFRVHISTVIVLLTKYDGPCITKNWFFILFTFYTLDMTAISSKQFKLSI